MPMIRLRRLILAVPAATAVRQALRTVACQAAEAAMIAYSRPPRQADDDFLAPPMPSALGFQGVGPATSPASRRKVPAMPPLGGDSAMTPLGAADCRRVSSPASRAAVDHLNRPSRPMRFGAMSGC